MALNKDKIAQVVKEDRTFVGLQNEGEAVDRIVSDYCSIEGGLNIDLKALAGGGSLPGVSHLISGSSKSIFDFVSFKPKNALLDLQKLITDASTLAFELPGSVYVSLGMNAPLAIPFLGLFIIWKHRDLFEVKLSARHAAAVLAIANSRAGEFATHAAAFQETNHLLEKHDQNTLSDQNFIQVTNELSDMGCIEIRDGNYYPVEKINLKG